MSRTSLANGALRHLKNSHTLTDVDVDTSSQAVAIRAVFDEATSEMVREYEWPPLKKVVALALVREGDSDDGDEFAYYYRWPSDCEKARYIVDGNMMPSTLTPRIPFEVTADGAERLIATDEESAILCYTKEMDDLDFMSAKFRRALEYKIAALVAPILTGGDATNLGPRAQANYERTMDEAWVEYLNERQRGTPPESEMIEGR